MVKLSTYLGAAAFACVVAAPAHATKDFSATLIVSPSIGGNMSALDDARGIAPGSVKNGAEPQRISRNDANAMNWGPEQAIWLMALFGFGLLGVTARGSTRLPSQQTL